MKGMTNNQIIMNEAAKLDPATLHAIATAHHTPEQIAAKAAIVEWLAQNAPMLAKEMPPCASFSFVEVFDKAQRDVYKYLHRKYDTETDWYTGAEHPAGAVPAADGSTYYFPEDRVTDALTKRGFNRCLNGYIPTKSK